MLGERTRARLVRGGTHSHSRTSPFRRLALAASSTNATRRSVRFCPAKRRLSLLSAEPVTGWTRSGHTDCEESAPFQRRPPPLLAPPWGASLPVAVPRRA